MELKRREVVSGLVGFSMAGPALAQKAPQAPSETVTVTGQTPIVTLQTWIDLYGRPTAEVKLNGQGPFKFVVDTGSNTSVLSPRVAKALELPELPMRTVHGVTGALISVALAPGVPKMEVAQISAPKRLNVLRL